MGSISLGFDAAGKRKRRTVYGSTKREVLDKLDALRNDARSGSLPAAGTITVGQALDLWLAATENRTAGKTHEERERLVVNHLRPRLGRLRLTAATALHVETLYLDILKDGVGASTVRHAGEALSSALNFAAKRKLIAANPAKGWSGRPRPRPSGCS
jgi:hypothetical protein